MPPVQLDLFHTATLAILVLFIGKGLVARVDVLRRYSIPEALVGGVLCALALCALYYLFGVELGFDRTLRDQLLLYFFAGIGLSSQFGTLARGGRPLAILSVLAILFMVLQNFTGMGMAALFGLEPQAGLMVGSVSLTGGVGTTMAWAPHFVENLGIGQAEELGMAANMLGLISACLIGGPIAAYLINRRNVRPSDDAALEVGAMHDDEPFVKLDYYGALLAVLWLNVALMLGEAISSLMALTPVTLPAFVGCLVAGLLLRGGADLLWPDGRGRLWNLRSMRPGMALISDISLGLFLTMALMGLRLWELQPVLGFITATMLVQIVLVVLFTVFVVFRAMGRDYEAVVVCSGFGGIALGSTATAVANMTAVAREYGAAPRAFIVVPLVCGFFIDLANALVISVLAR